MHLLTDVFDSAVLGVLFLTGPLEGKRFTDVSENAFYWYFVVLSWLPIDLVIYRGARHLTREASMRTFLGLIVAPSLALACQSAMFSLVTPACAVQTRWPSMPSPSRCWRSGCCSCCWRGALRPAGRGDVVRCMGAVFLLPLSLLLLLPGVAAAHARGPLTAAPSLWEWNLAPWLLALLLGSAVLYGHGIRRLWRSAGRGRGISASAVVAFALGWLALVLALVSPLDPLGGRLLSAHMVQHELLMVVAAPLLVIGRPLAAWAWAFEPPVRQALARTARTAPVQLPWQALTDPMIAWGLYAVALWSWHVPRLFTAALENGGIHILQHSTFLASALFFWWAALGHDPRRGQSTGQAIALLFTTMLHTAALGALLGLAPTPWYEPYIATTHALGIDPVDDQRLGGLVMWVPAGLAYVVVALVLLGRLLTRQGQETREGRPRVP